MFGKSPKTALCIRYLKSAVKVCSFIQYILPYTAVKGRIPVFSVHIPAAIHHISLTLKYRSHKFWYFFRVMLAVCIHRYNDLCAILSRKIKTGLKSHAFPHVLRMANNFSTCKRSDLSSAVRASIIDNDHPFCMISCVKHHAANRDLLIKCREYCNYSFAVSYTHLTLPT